MGRISRRTLFQSALVPFIPVIDLRVWAVRCKGCINHGEKDVWVQTDPEFPSTIFCGMSKPQLMTKAEAKKIVGDGSYAELVFLP